MWKVVRKPSGWYFYTEAGLPEVVVRVKLLWLTGGL